MAALAAPAPLNDGAREASMGADAMPSPLEAVWAAAAALEQPGADASATLERRRKDLRKERDALARSVLRSRLREYAPQPLC